MYITKYVYYCGEVNYQFAMKLTKLKPLFIS